MISTKQQQRIPTTIVSCPRCAAVIRRTEDKSSVPGTIAVGWPGNSPEHTHGFCASRRLNETFSQRQRGIDVAARRRMAESQTRPYELCARCQTMLRRQIKLRIFLALIRKLLRDSLCKFLRYRCSHSMAPLRAQKTNGLLAPVSYRRRFRPCTLLNPARTLSGGERPVR